MATSDELLQKFIEALAAEGCITGDFEADVIGMVGRLRAARTRAIRDMEAARLLPLGAVVVATRQGCHRVTAYRRAKRAIVAARLRDATQP